MTPELAIIESLWKTWLRESVVPPANGNRLFVRYVDTDPAELGWDDWRLCGLVNADRSIQWNDPDDARSPLGGSIGFLVRAGHRRGHVTSGTLRIEWGLFLGDGPDGDRVSDWSKPGGGDEIPSLT